MNIVNTIATPEQADNHATQSGAWSSPATWSTGVPKEGSKVYIPPKILVQVSGMNPAAPFWILVEGTLSFDAGAASTLTAESVLVMHDGKLEMGTESVPVTASAKLVVKALNGGAINRQWDPMAVSRGLIVEGRFEAQGQFKTKWLPVSTPPAVGSKSLKLDSAPSGWNVGDRIVLTGVQTMQDEQFAIVSMAGATVTLDKAVQFARPFPASPVPLCVHCGNLTRNVIIESDVSGKGNPQLQGHVMLMQGPHAIRYAGFHDLGRTIIKTVTDPKLLPESGYDPQLMPLCSAPNENVRGRYSLHFHQAGTFSDQSVVDGCVVTVQRGSKFKLGIVNHTSNVSARNNISLNIDGSHYFTEVGDEVGDFTGNLAIHSDGSNAVSDDQENFHCIEDKYPEIAHEPRLLDMGHRGHGFWLQSGGVRVEGNVAVDHANSGFNFGGRGIFFFAERGTAPKFPNGALTGDTAWAGGKDVDFANMPFVAKNNICYVSGDEENAEKSAVGDDMHGQHTLEQYPAGDAPKNLIDGFLGWNVRTGVATSYHGWTIYQNVVLIALPAPTGDPRPPTTYGMALGTQGGNHVDLVNVKVNGFTKGIGPAQDMTVSNVTVDGKSYSPISRDPLPRH